MAKQWQAEFDEGRQAAQEECELTSNPYPFSSDECAAWLLGYYYEITGLGHE